MRRLLGTLLLVAAVTVPAPAHADSCDWAMYGHDAAHTFAAPAGCSSLTATRAPTLHPKWFVPTDDSVTASPTIVDGVLYVGSWDGTFYAVDAASGDVKWTFLVTDTHRTTYGRIVSSAAVDTIDVPGAGPKRVVLFGGGATLYALEHDPTLDHAVLVAQVDVDPRTPELREAQADDPPQIEIESSPVVGHFPDGDRIFVGMDVHNAAGVGRTGVLSFGLRNAEDGQTPLRFELLYKFDPERDVLLYSLTEGSGTGFGCGGVWSSPALDASALGGDGVVVFGTSNCDNAQQSHAAGEVGREGLFAIRAKTGELLWEFHPRDPNDVDDDFGASANILPGGLAGEGSKDGWYYARDLLTGTEQFSSHLGQSGHVSSGFAVGGIIGTPAVGWVLVRDGDILYNEPAVFATTALSTPIGTPFDPGLADLDRSLVEDPGRMFSLHAIDATDGHVLWRTPMSRQSYGAPTFANGVVLVPSTFSFSVWAFEASTGLPLWTFPLPGAPSSAPALVGDSVYIGVGTRETDAEFKAFGDDLGNLLSGLLGAHPLSRLSGIAAFRV
jgi:outer membrane protein assembly factor BamB